MKARGFVLQASYRIASGVPVVHLYGRLDNGETFLLRDHRQRPHFFIESADTEPAARLGIQSAPTDLETFRGTPVARVDVPVPPDAPGVRDRLHDAGIDTYEADVRFAVRYLIDRDIRGGLEIDGQGVPGDRIDWIFDDPEVVPAAVEVKPSVLSFDIETDPDARHVLAIALYGDGVDEVLVVDPGAREMPERATGFPNEATLLRAFCERVNTINPDVLTGWNVIDFDLTVLTRAAERLRLSFELGRDAGAVRIRPAQGYFGSGHASIPGRLVLDGMDLVRGAFVRFDEYSLDAVATRVLGEGKTLSGENADRAEEILERYRSDLPGFALYARTDARLALEIIERMDLLRLAVARSQLTGMTPDRVAASIASFDFLYLAELGKRGIVAPSVKSRDSRVHVAQAGGYVFEPETGLHEYVLVFDFKSLYPSIMRTFNIDPLTFVGDPDPDEDLIRLPGGAAFSRAPAILPGMLDALFPSREAAKRRGDGVASQAIKILMNSFYGVLGTPACRFHNPAIANAITGQGQHILRWSKSWFESAGYRVLYGDTDSLFVAAGVADAARARNLGPTLARRVTAEVAEYVAERWGVESRLELEFEKLYLKLFLPSVRHGDAGARKRYAGRVDGSDSVEFVGMEVVRRDWTELAKRVQRELYERLFSGEPVDAYLADTVARLRQGEFDELLVYRKGLRKSLSEYTTTTPPHVTAARKSNRTPGRVIRYLVTTDGPEPLDNLQHPPDREHYVHKQVQPVAEPVLGALGLAFASVIGDDTQMELF